jgi:rRNA maturation protein Nop10
LLVVLFMLFTSVFATLGPIDPVAAAQRNCPDGQERNDLGQCVDEVEVIEGEQLLLQPTEEPTDDGDDQPSDDGDEQPTDDGDEQPSDDGDDYQPEATGWLDIYKFECPAGFDGSNSNLDDFSSQCSDPHEGVYFEVFSESSGGVGSGNTDGSGHIAFNDLAPEFHSITEDVPDGYGTPYVFCSYGDDENSAGEYQSFDVIDGYYVDLDYNDYAYYSCYWYNIPEYDGGITIYKYVCDDTETSLPQDGWDWSDYQDYCHGDLGQYNDFAYELNDSSGVPTSQLVGDRIPDGVYFDEYEYGQVSITELEEDGWGTPIVYCGVVPAGAQAPQSPQEYQADDSWTVSFDVEEGGEYVCYWFNIPDGHDITIYKYYCDEAYDAAQYDYDWYFEECTDWHDGATFWVGDESKSIDGSDNVWWDDVAYGDTTFREEHEEGYGTPVVYCWQVGEDQSLAEPTQYDVSDTGEWTAPYEDGYKLICYVFNQPDNGHDVTIYKYYCDEAYDAAQYDYDWYFEECTDWHDGATFWVGDESKSIDGSDNVWWDDVAYGDLTIREEHEEGYGTPVVYCWQVGEDTSLAEPTRYDVSDTGEWTAPYQDGYKLVCYVYNQPEDYDITVYKFYCLPDYQDMGYDYQWYVENCTDTHDGAVFYVGDEERTYGEDSGEGSAKGVSWQGIGYGDVTIGERHEDGYGTPVVYCWSGEGSLDSAVFEQYEVSESGEWTYPWSEGKLICFVFNIPDGGHDVTIYKFWCDSGYAPAAESYDSYLQDCTTVRGGETLYVGDEEKTIGEDAQNSLSNSVVWDDVPAGDLTMGERPGDGYGRPVVYCWLVGEDASLAAPQQMQLSDTGEWVYPYQDGYQLICYVFNFPTDDHDITIYKYYCDEAYDYAQYDYDWYFENCTDWHDGATFWLGDESKAISGSDNVWWDDVAYGDTTLREEHEEGYGTPVVYCWQVGEDTSLAEPTRYDVSDTGEWTTPYQDGYKLICYVFNQPDDHDITIYKYYCDPGYEVADYDYQWYLDNCTDWHDGATFWIGDESKAISGTDNVWWDDVAYGDLTIREEHESGYGTPVVYCWQVGDDPALVAPTRYDVSETGEWTTPYQDGYKLICYVFNIPDDHDIVVYKYICPYGFDYEHASIEDLYEYCEVIAIPIPFTLYDGDTELATQSTGEVLAGGVAFDGYEATGGYRIVEEEQEGYEDPRVFCRVVTTTTEPILFASTELTEYDVEDYGIVLGGDEAAAATYDYGWYCEWFNFEGAADDNTVTIHKWECPVFEGAWEDNQNWLLENCTQAMEGVEFNLDDIAGPRSLSTDATGTVEWTDVNNGPFTVSESIPEGYGQPSVFCGWTAFYNGAVYDAPPQKVDAPEGVWTSAIDVPNFDLFCDWFNFPDQPGDITIYKYWCPEGYDLYDWGANPEKDCTTWGEGIEFSLNGESKLTDNEGTVFWGDLEPGEYTVAETYPEGTDYSFVLNCYGGRYAGIQPYPLQFDSELNVKLVAGDHIYCYWYNVPDRDYGWITVYKYWCSTKTYKSDIDCQVYEDGVTFELYTYPGDDKVDEKTTSEYGELTFGNLDTGEYTMTEKGYKWCAIDISSKGDNDSIQVTSGQETVVKVYNCDLPEDPGDPETPKKPKGKVPTKYPNTGVEPTAYTLPATGVGPIEGSDMSIVIAMLAVATVLTLAAGGFVLRRRQTTDAEVEVTSTSTSTSTAHGSITTRRVMVGAAIGAFALPFAVAAQGDGNGSGDGDGEGNGQGDGSGNGQEGAEGTPEGTPDVPQCREDATPDASDPDEDPDCIRGEVPKHIKIEVIGVDADIEIQEIIAGQMQDPTGPTLVTWYKETTRLGERGNGVYAGHLNYWGVPEGVFFAIKQLQPGDEIVLTGENDEEFIYAVAWVENQPGQDDPDPEVLGLTEEESITLITCGGEWDTTIAEYNERTAVRAVRRRAEPA